MADTEVRRYEKLLAKAERDSKKACMARGNLPTGSSRARITTANARWMRAAEYRDLTAAKLDELGGDSAHDHRAGRNYAGESAMSPKERTVVLAVVRALKSNARSCQIDMDALATSYELPPHYALARPKARAAMLLKALTESKP